MIAAFLALILPFAPLLGAGAGVTNAVIRYRHAEHYAWNEVEPRSTLWYELCKNRYKSFDEISGLYLSHNGKWRRCRFKYVLN